MGCERGVKGLTLCHDSSILGMAPHLQGPPTSFPPSHPRCWGAASCSKRFCAKPEPGSGLFSAAKDPRKWNWVASCLEPISSTSSFGARALQCFGCGVWATPALRIRLLVALNQIYLLLAEVLKVIEPHFLVPPKSGVFLMRLQQLATPNQILKPS